MVDKEDIRFFFGRKAPRLLEARSKGDIAIPHVPSSVPISGDPAEVIEIADSDDEGVCPTPAAGARPYEGKGIIVDPADEGGPKELLQGPATVSLAARGEGEGNYSVEEKNKKASRRPCEQWGPQSPTSLQ